MDVVFWNLFKLNHTDFKTYKTESNFAFRFCYYKEAVSEFVHNFSAKNSPPLEGWRKFWKNF